MKLKQIIRSEEDECIALVEYLNLLKNQGKVITYTHIPNETYTSSWNQKRKNKAMGVASGFPDYIILGTMRIIFLEMKREKGGITSVEQKIWIEALNGYSTSVAVVAKGFKEAERYLSALL